MTEIRSRDEQHPAWCVDHQHDFIGPHGECHGPIHGALGVPPWGGRDLEAHLYWPDGERKPVGYIAYCGADVGEAFAEIPVDAIDLLLHLIDTHPDELAPMLRHLADTLRTDVPA